MEFCWGSPETTTEDEPREDSIISRGKKATEQVVLKMEPSVFSLTARVVMEPAQGCWLSLHSPTSVHWAPCVSQGPQGHLQMTLARVWAEQGLRAVVKLTG